MKPPNHILLNNTPPLKRRWNPTSQITITNSTTVFGHSVHWAHNQSLVPRNRLDFRMYIPWLCLESSVSTRISMLMAHKKTIHCENGVCNLLSDFLILGIIFIIKSKEEECVVYEVTDQLQRSKRYIVWHFWMWINLSLSFFVSFVLLSLQLSQTHTKFNQHNPRVLYSSNNN